MIELPVNKTFDRTSSNAPLMRTSLEVALQTLKEHGGSEMASDLISRLPQILSDHGVDAYFGALVVIAQITKYARNIYDVNVARRELMRVVYNGAGYDCTQEAKKLEILRRQLTPAKPRGPFIG